MKYSLEQRQSLEKVKHWLGGFCLIGFIWGVGFGDGFVLFYKKKQHQVLSNGKTEIKDFSSSTQEL